jgi:hypothetical protein
MSDDNINMEVAPSYKFKPIDFSSEHVIVIDDGVGDDVQDLRQPLQEQRHEPQIGSGMIFREVPDNSGESDILVRRANPVGSYPTVEDDLDSSCRVISPYPFSHTSQEEIQDREHLAGAFDWTLLSDQDIQAADGERVFEMDYAQFFDMMDGMDVDSTGSPDETDDFSVASNVSYDLCLDRTDPTTFWNAGVDILVDMKNEAQQRSDSPSQVSLDS